MFHFSFKIVNIVCEAKSEGWQDPNIYSWRAGSVIASVNSNSINMFIGNGLSTFLIKGKQFFSNDPKSLPKNSPDCPILCNWVFDNFKLVIKLRIRQVYI